MTPNLHPTWSPSGFEGPLEEIWTGFLKVFEIHPKRILNLMQKVSQNGLPEVVRKLVLFGDWLPGGPQGAPRRSPRCPRQLFGVIFHVIFVFFVSLLKLVWSHLLSLLKLSWII